VAVSERFLRGLRIPLFLLLFLLPAAYRGSCDGPTTTLRTELEDLATMKSRLLIDFSASPYGFRRLMYVENRRFSKTEGTDALVPPERWAVGVSSPLITAGPVSLRGILAQLYNPLAHAPGSEVYSDTAGLSLSIDLDVTSRRGLQLQVIPGHWSLLGIYKKQIGAQVGSVIVVPFGRRIACTLVGLLSAPPDRLEDDHAWYVEQTPFPGGPIGHLAGSLVWELDPLRFSLAAAGSGGQWVVPGTFATLRIGLSAAPVDLDLLLGSCSLEYFTPQGDKGDLEWIVAARAKGDFGALHLSAAWRKELSPLSPFPGAFRESRDQLNAGIQIILQATSGWSWSIQGEAELEREWSSDGQGRRRRCLDAGSTLDWSLVSLSAGVKEEWVGDCERVQDARLEVGCDCSWAEARLEAGYRRSRVSGTYLAGSLEAVGDGKRIYIRLETKDVLPPFAAEEGRRADDWLKLFNLRVGWEAEARRRSGRQCRR
jgi:hypothetical protein